MKTKDIFEISRFLDNEIDRLSDKLDRIKLKRAIVKDNCPHGIVFKFKDNLNRSIPLEGMYYCPACGKTLKCYYTNQIKDTVFKKSKIIFLRNLFLVGTPDTLEAIRKEVGSKIEIYYDGRKTNW